MRPLDIAFLMDPIGGINIHKDSTFAMLLEAQARGHRCHYLELADLSVRDGKAWGRLRPVTVKREPGAHYQLGEPAHRPLAEMDALLMRKDPPFDMDYIFASYLLEHAGTWVINDPVSLRNANEKLYALYFPELMPRTLVSRHIPQLREFLAEEGEVVVKPLYGRGGEGVFYLHTGDRNVGSILETVTGTGRHYVMAQRYIPAVRDGDKRILMVDGEPIAGALLRVPAADDFRGNMVAGASAQPAELTPRDREICARVGPRLRQDGLVFVGLDVIGGHLTEINVTSPTGVQEIDRFFKTNVCARLFDVIEARLS
ncbi:MAG: glutathione synthase [Pseudomonadota bacterium]